MMKDMESMRVQFANMMAKQPQLHAELAELRAHAKVAPQLYAEVNQLKASLQAARTVVFLAPSVLVSGARVSRAPLAA
ncbi:uncharacterized protein PITG_18077 [Phytophthora infestans T30-4]|uniref:Uncharacterized protein n=1 Tax=Phytophthora infestans (strain T30-4) TaxID=403677 RepID=D0NY51_PHYIT|nr:uncharacterized protein PITG_18077 [Phytophthora infestans T30-4]EEY68009.1 hypothetical protein PITG_18077 [Phytophthora infestans T30-4]|eukprot:XP_002997708.1 hypothetical protein PITG_18077 [Phytophthora infestans T30-4]